MTERTITLRKANAIQALIEDYIRKNPLVLSARLNLYDDLDEQLKTATDDALSVLGNHTDLTTAVGEIRASVSAANHNSGISDILCRIAVADKLIKTVSAVVDAGTVRSVASLKGELERARNSNYGVDVSTPVTSTDMNKRFISQLAGIKKTKNNLKDSLIHLNITTEITLSKFTVELLEELDLI